MSGFADKPAQPNLPKSIRLEAGAAQHHPCANTRSACALIVLTIDAKPLERVGERCLPNPIALMNAGSVSRISRALRPEYTRSSSAIRPETMAESLAARRSRRVASPDTTIHTCD